MKYIAETKGDNEALKIIGAFVQDDSKLFERERAFAVTVISLDDLMAALNRHGVGGHTSYASRIRIMADVEARLSINLSKYATALLDDVAAEAAATHANRPYQSNAKASNPRFRDCHIWEPGDRLDSFADQCEILIKAADINALIHDGNHRRVLGVGDFERMVGQPVFIREKRYPSDAGYRDAGWHIVPEMTTQRVLGGYMDSWFMGEKRGKENYGLTWIACSGTPEANV